MPSLLHSLQRFLEHDALARWPIHDFFLRRMNTYHADACFYAMQPLLLQCPLRQPTCHLTFPAGHAAFHIGHHTEPR